MNKENKSRTKIIGVVVVFMFLSVCLSILIFSGSDLRAVINQQVESLSHDKEQENFTRRDHIPELPFPDNPDPDQCGIPIDWGNDNQAWLTGYYQNELIQPIVYLYDGHLRVEVTAQVPHGTEVEVILFQYNPVLDYYLVRITGAEGPGSQGWVPAPLLSFEPVK